MNLNENTEELYKLEMALTSSYIDLANFIVKSDIDWDSVSRQLKELKESKDIKANWEMVRKKSPSVKRLFDALTNQNIESFYKSLTPLKKRHQSLINALQKYQNMYYIAQDKYMYFYAFLLKKYSAFEAETFLNIINYGEKSLFPNFNYQII